MTRGANGTTSMAHDQDSPIDVFDFPPGVSEAVIIQASRLLRHSDGSHGAPPVPRGPGRPNGADVLDADAAFLLAGYRKAALGAGVR